MVLTLLLLFGMLSTPVATPVGLPTSPDWTVSTGIPVETGSEASMGLLIVGDMVIVATQDRTLLALDARTGDSVWATSISENIAAPMATSGEYLLVAGEKGTLFVLDLATGTVTRAIVLGAKPLLEPLVVSGSIVVGDAHGTVHILDAESMEPQATHVVGGSVKHASAAGDLAIFASAEGMVTAIDPATDSVAWQAVVAGIPAQTQVVGDGIVLGMKSGDLVMLNAADGTVRWHQAIVASPFTDIASASTGVLGITEAGDLLMVDMATGTPMWRGVLPSGGWFAGNQCDPGCPVVTTDGSLFLFTPATGEHPVAITALQHVVASPAATSDVLVVITQQGDVHGWVRDPA